jgi:serine/threonine protein kinase
MDTSFFRFLNPDIDREKLDIIVSDMLLQVADILDFFQSKLYFNHRDLKTDNVMITMVGDRRIYKIIDFGMSCLMWNQLNIVTTSHRFTTCFREGRDLAQLIYDLLAHHDYISERLKEWMLGLQLLAVGTSWGNSYWRFNIQSKSQAKPQRIINSIKALPFYRPIAASAPVAAAGAAVPLGSLSLSPNSSLGEFSPLELEMAIRSSVKPAGHAGAAEDENQVGLPGIFGGYKRKRKHKKTRNLRKRKGTRKSKSY